MPTHRDFRDIVLIIHRNLACCIDKSSSADLSEAINSMFAWYRNAEIGYVYLEDVQHDLYDTSQADVRLAMLDKARWFTRGWTLQELLAPSNVEFYGREWAQEPESLQSWSQSQKMYKIGDKASLGAILPRITGIDFAILNGSLPMRHASVAQRMSWASARHTTRLEDQAHCLMGIFDVNMPLLYGEGRKAFYRLQDEIMKQDDDQSLFAWTTAESISGDDEGHGLLADSPSAFARSGQIRPYRSIANAISRSIGSRGLSLSLSMLKTYGNNRPNTRLVDIGLLECYEIGKQGRPAVVLKPVDSTSAGNHYTRIQLDRLVWEDDYEEPTEIFVRHLNIPPDRQEFMELNFLHFGDISNGVIDVEADGTAPGPVYSARDHFFRPQDEVCMPSKPFWLIPDASHILLGKDCLLPDEGWERLRSKGLYAFPPTPLTLSAVIHFAHSGSDIQFLLLLGSARAGLPGFEIREPSDADLERISTSEWPITFDRKFQPLSLGPLPGVQGVHVDIQVDSRDRSQNLAPRIQYFKAKLYITHLKRVELPAEVDKPSRSSWIKRKLPA